MKQNTNAVIWITGASSGIGEALAYEYARKKYTLILSSRRLEELERVKMSCESLGAVCSIIKLDLTVSTEIVDAVNKLSTITDRLDILVHNGGISQRSLVAETPIDVDRRVFETNFWGSVLLTKQLLPLFIKQQSGHIVVVSSITGKFGFSLRSAYSASKHALHGYFEALRCEVKKDNIKVTIVCPGRVHTNISLHALTKDGKEHGEMDHGQSGGISSIQCAKEIRHAVEKNKKEVLIGGRELLLVHIKRFLPRLFYYMVNKVKPT